MAFVLEGQADSSQARSAWVATQRGPVTEGRSKSLSVPQIFVVETEPRHEQATARRAPASETPGLPAEKLGSDDVRPDFGCNEWFLATARTYTESAITLLSANVVPLSQSLVSPGHLGVLPFCLAIPPKNGQSRSLN